MTLVRNWINFGPRTFTDPNGQGLSVANLFLPAGATLQRTIMDLNFQWTFNIVGWPPPPLPAMRWGVYTSTNTINTDELPNAQDGSGEWVGYGLVGWTAGFGTISDLQSDLTWSAHATLDSHAQRKLLQANRITYLSVSLDPFVGGFPAEPSTREIWYSTTIRQLWQHQI